MSWCIDDYLWVKRYIAILTVKGVGFRCILWGISRDKPIYRLNNSVLQDRGVF